MKNITKIFAAFMIMVMVLTASAPVVTEAKTTIKVTNKATGRKVGKKVTLTAGEKLQLKVTYNKKNVTKKAKYKASSGRIKVSKKGKITAKSAGTCTVKVSYKKMSKKIIVVVKDGKEQTLEEERTEAVTEEEKSACLSEAEKERIATETPKIEMGRACNWDRSNLTDAAYNKLKKGKKVSKKEMEAYVAMFIEDHQNDPHPECTHEWELSRVIVDGIDGDGRVDGGGLDWDHLFLDEIYCPKCGKLARTVAVPYNDVKNYTSEDFAKTILYYDDVRPSFSPRHKHKKVYGWSPYTIPGYDGIYGWESDDRCYYCDGNYMFGELD